MRSAALKAFSADGKLRTKSYRYNRIACGRRRRRHSGNLSFSANQPGGGGCSCFLYAGSIFEGYCCGFVRGCGCGRAGYGLRRGSCFCLQRSAAAHRDCCRLRVFGKWGVGRGFTAVFDRFCGFNTRCGKAEHCGDAYCRRCISCCSG